MDRANGRPMSMLWRQNTVFDIGGKPLAIDVWGSESLDLFSRIVDNSKSWKPAGIAWTPPQWWRRENDTFWAFCDPVIGKAWTPTASSSLINIDAKDLPHSVYCLLLIACWHSSDASTVVATWKWRFAIPGQETAYLRPVAVLCKRLTSFYLMFLFFLFLYCWRI